MNTIMNTIQFYGKISPDGMMIRRDPVKATEYVDFKLLLGKDSAPVPFRAFGDMARTIYLHAAPGDRLIGEAKFFTVEKYFRFDVLSVEFVDRSRKSRTNGSSHCSGIESTPKR